MKGWVWTTVYDVFGGRIQLHKVGVFSLIVGLHGAALWLMLQATVRSPVDAAVGVLQLRFVEAEQPAPPADVPPEFPVQLLPMQVRIPETPILEPLVTADTQQATAAATAITSHTGPSEKGEPEWKPPDFEADYLSNPAPAYPPLSRQLREQGMTSLRVHVATDGRPVIIELEQSSGYARLDKAAIAAVWQWRFVPAKQGEMTVAAWVIVPIRFSLRG